MNSLVHLFSFTFFLDEKSKQKSQDHTILPRSSYSRSAYGQANAQLILGVLSISTNFNSILNFEQPSIQIEFGIISLDRQ